MTPQPKPQKTVEEILTKAFNDFYDYITEHDIIKVAHEYSEKTVFKEALTQIQALHNAQIPEKAVLRADDWDWDRGYKSGYNQAIDDFKRWEDRKNG